MSTWEDSGVGGDSERKMTQTMWLRLVDITLSSPQWVERGEVARLHQHYSAAGRGKEGWEGREGGREEGREGGKEEGKEKVAVGHGRYIYTVEFRFYVYMCKSNLY